MGLITWPFKLAFTMVALFLGLLGHILSAVLGVAFAVAGLALSATLIGAVIGIPLLLFGVLLFFKSLF